MASTRLRRAFRYDDDDTHSDHEVLDEEEQEALIQTLAEQNQRRNEQFRQFLLIVPGLAMVPFLVACFARPSSSSMLVSLLGLTSLGATAYQVHRLPPTRTGIRALDAWSGADIKGKGRAAPPLFSMSLSSPGFGSGGPLEQHLPVLNFGLCVMLILSLFLPGGRSAAALTSVNYLVLGSLPAIVYGVVLISKVTMAGVDPERDLNRLRYEYKGA